MIRSQGHLYQALRDAEAQKQAEEEAAAKIQAGILFAGIGALVKFSMLIAISLLTSTIGIALMMGGSMITLYGCCLFNRQPSQVLPVEAAQLHPTP